MSHPGTKSKFIVLDPMGDADKAEIGSEIVVSKRKRGGRRYWRFAGQQLADKHHLSNSFMNGFLFGLGAVPALYCSEHIAPKYRSSGVAGDWAAVGRQIKGAMAAESDDSKRTKS